MERECLFAGEEHPVLIGTATLKGIYGTRERALPGPQTSPEMLECEEIVVTEGPPEFLQRFRALIESGNTINRLTDEDRLAMTVRPEALDDSEQTRIRASSEVSPVELLVLSPTPDHFSPSSACLSGFVILKVN
jgi:hypothetical protein